ncbi:hypothetical protein OUZ56_020411 [Daphnia magna]|uniref:Uncharacterized protein n=1 Tax=Daphnia magna TaxID=35525 RepID=A0ABQ9ZEE6_9CRUS|nr:hypothetical protein OUZ56_020411 [Daphnia magna]
MQGLYNQFRWVPLPVKLFIGLPSPGISMDCAHSITLFITINVTNYLLSRPDLKLTGSETNLSKGCFIPEAIAIPGTYVDRQQYYCPQVQESHTIQSFTILKSRSMSLMSLVHENMQN